MSAGPKKKKRSSKPLSQRGAPIPTEDEEQMVVVEWLEKLKVFFCHVPNQRKSHVSFIRRLIKMGMRRGMPDLLVFTKSPVNGCPTAIELKRIKGGKLSLSQKECLDALHDEGWNTAVCFGADQAIQELTDLGYYELSRAPKHASTRQRERVLSEMAVDGVESEL